MSKKSETNLKKFMVIAGFHRISKVVGKGPSGEPIMIGKNVAKGECFESDKDLARLYPEKFIEAIADSPVVRAGESDEENSDGASSGTVGDDILDSLVKMSLPALKDYASKNGIDLGEFTKKEDVLNAIVEAISNGDE